MPFSFSNIKHNNGTEHRGTLPETPFPFAVGHVFDSLQILPSDLTAIHAKMLQITGQSEA